MLPSIGGLTPGRRNITDIVDMGSSVDALLQKTAGKDDFGVGCSRWIPEGYPLLDTARLSLQGSSIQVDAGPASRWLGDDLAAELA